MPKSRVQPGRAPRPVRSPALSLLTALAIAVPSIGLGAFGDQVVEKAQDVLGSSPTALLNNTIEPADPTLALPVAAPRVYPRELADVRSRLGDAASPAELEELLARVGILGDTDDIDTLVPFLGHPTTTVRYAAFQALGRIGGDRAVERLAAYAWAPMGDEDVYPAIAALGLAADDEAGNALVKLAASPQQWRRDAAQGALASRGGPVARRVLHRALLNGPANQAWYAAQNVGRLGEAPDAMLLMRLASNPGERGDAALSALQGLPGDTVDTYLIALARDARGTRRDQAIAALGAVRDPEALDLLAEFVVGSPRHRTSAWMALGESRAPGAIATLLDLLPEATTIDAWGVASALAARPEKEARLALRSLAVGDDALADSALSALAGAGDEKATDLLLARYDVDGRLPPADALTFLATNGGDEGWQLLEEVLAEGNQSDRNSVIWALQMRGDGDAVSRLLDLAGGDDAMTGSTAMSALEMMGEDARDGLRSILVERIEAGEDGDYGQSMQTLARLGGDEARGLLEQRLETGTQMERINALSALGSMEDPEARDTLTNVFRTAEDPAMRNQALSTLLWSGDGLPEDLVQEALDDGDPAVVAQVVAALPQTGLPDVTERLVALADSDDLAVKSAALNALTQAGGVGAEDTLVAALADPDVAQSAMWNLQSLGTPGARQAIRDAASDRDPALRVQALGALASDNSSDALELLTGALSADSDEVVGASLSALQSRGNSAAAEAIADYLRFADPNDVDTLGLRSQAAWALQGIGGSVASEHADLISSIVGDDGMANGDSGYPFMIGTGHLGLEYGEGHIW